MNYQELLQGLKKRRENILSGKVNCIPSPFRRFSNDFVGIEQGKTVMISANSKVGKTQLANYLFVYQTLFYAMRNPDKIRLKIYYFNLEETAENITLRFISHLLYIYSKGKYRIGTKDLKSTRVDKPLDEEILKILDEDPYKSVMEFYDKTVDFRPERNPTGISKAIETFCLENGTVKRKKIQILNKDIGEMETVEAFDSYIPNDPDLYFIPIIDHFALMQCENNLSTKQTMDLMSSYLVKLRNRYNISAVEVVQQAAEMESTENFKQKKLRPTAQGIGESKTLIRDVDVMLGLFSPYRHEIPSYMGYDITRFRNHIRFMEVVVNREGEQNGVCPLYFDGMTNNFIELEKPGDPALQKYYNTIEHLNIMIKKKKKKNIFKKINKFLRRY